MEYNCVWAIGDEIVFSSSELIWVMVDIVGVIVNYVNICMMVYLHVLYILCEMA